MKTTIDAAGRVVIPRAIREQVGLYGTTEVDVEIDGSGIRIEPATVGAFVEEEGRLVIPSTGVPLTAEMVDRLRDADRR